MKALKSEIVKKAKEFWNDEEAQGMMEYILLAVVVIAIITVAKPYVIKAVEGSGDKLKTSVDVFSGN